MTDRSSTAVEPDAERIDRVTAALRESNLDALLCSIPSHVLMLTGFWPVMANTVALFTRDGAVHLVLPKDEQEIAAKVSAAQCTGFEPGSLKEITNSEKAIPAPLTGLMRSLKLERARIGVEICGLLSPTSYLAQFRYGPRIREIIQEYFPHADLVGADDLLNRLSMVKTARELDRLRLSCNIARAAYQAGSKSLHNGLHEPEAAELFRSAFAHSQLRDAPVRADAFFFCMSGANSATAYAAYARTRTRAIRAGDLVMIHCNSNADGYWTDITRTFTCSASEAKQKEMRAAVLEARSAALARIGSGVAASEIDKAARDVLTARGFGKEFKHATGHGVCFAASNHDAIPRVHPKSTDVLETGMTFNIEPAIYIEDYGGIRHCDVVAVTARGAEVLTDFQSNASELDLHP